MQATHLGDAWTLYPGFPAQGSPLSHRSSTDGSMAQESVVEQAARSVVELVPHSVVVELAPQSAVELVAPSVVVERAPRSAVELVPHSVAVELAGHSLAGKSDCCPVVCHWFHCRPYPRCPASRFARCGCRSVHFADARPTLVPPTYRQRRRWRRVFVPAGRCSSALPSVAIARPERRSLPPISVAEP